MLFVKHTLSFSNEEKLLGFVDLVSIADISSQAGRAECPIRHSTRQKTELELGRDFVLGEPSQALYLIPITSSSRARAHKHS
jgi:hypothetical protein